MAILFRRSNGYYYLISSVNGKQVWKSTGCRTKAHALKWLTGPEAEPTANKSKTEPAGILLSEFRIKFLQYAQAGKKSGRSTEDETIIFDSTGMALQDVAAAALVYEKRSLRKQGHFTVWIPEIHEYRHRPE